MPETKVYIGNLDPDATDRDLEREFAKFGKIAHIWIARKPPGFAFITYEDIRDAEDACAEFNGKTILSQRVRVEISTTRSGGGGGGGGGGRRGGGGDRYGGGGYDDRRRDGRGGGGRYNDDRYGGGGRGGDRDRSPPARRRSGSRDKYSSSRRDDSPMRARSRSPAPRGEYADRGGGRSPSPPPRDSYARSRSRG